MLKTLIPWRVRHWFSTKHRAMVLKRAMAQLIANPERCLVEDDPLLSDLVYGWDNTAWSAETEYLVACIEHAMLTKGTILECGSGISTLILGVIAKQRNLGHIALESSPEWRQHVSAYLAHYGLTNTQVVDAPIKSYEDFEWYEAPPKTSLGDVTLVICDGPPSKTRGGRFGLMPVMHSALSSECIILLDDAERQEEQDIADNWQRRYGTRHTMVGEEKPYFHIAMPGYTPN